MPAVFISYSRRDKAFVQRLHDALRAHQYDVWVDWEDIPPSAEWFQEIEAGVRGADGFIYVISPDSVSSAVCTKELDNALGQNKRVVPVVYREPGTATVPAQAAALNWVFLRDSDNFDAGLATLITALETDLDYVRVHTRLGVQAARWDSSKRDRSLLIRGSELAAAEQWLAAGAGKRPEATQLQREYLLASRQSATRRQRSLIAGVSVALVVALVLAVVALVQRSNAVHEKNIAVAHGLDADALNTSATDPELSLMLANRAAQVVDNAQTEAGLRAALAESNVRARYPLTSKFGGDVVWSPDGNRLLMTSPGLRPDNWARIYTPGANDPPVSMPGPSTPGASGWDAAGNRVVIGGGLPAVYDADTGHLIRQFPGPAIHAALVPDGSRVVMVGETGTARVYDVATGRLLVTFRARYSGGTTCFALSPDGQYVAQCDSSTSDLTSKDPSAVDVWSTATGRPVRTVASSTVIDSVAFSPDGARFVYTTTGPILSAEASIAAKNKAVGAAGTFVYNTVGSSRPVISFPGAASVAVFGPSATDESVAWATIGDDTAHVYQFYTGRTLALTGATDVIDTIRFDINDAYVLVTGRDDVIRVYDTGAAGPPVETLAGAKGPITDASFGDGSEYVASSSDDGNALLWQGPTPIPSLRRLDAPLRGDGGVPTAAFTLVGNRIVVGGGGYRLSAQGRILNGSTLGIDATFNASPGQLLAGSLVSRDGSLVVAYAGTPGDGHLESAVIETFNGHTGARLATIGPGAGHALVNAVLDFGGTELATMESGGRVELWNPRTGRLLHVLTGATSAAQATVFSQDGTVLAVAHVPSIPAHMGYLSQLGPVIVQLWNTRTGRLERTIRAQALQPQTPGESDFAPLALAFSPDGKLLALTGAETDVQLFDPRTGAQAHAPLSLQGLSGGTSAGTLAFSPNGRFLAAGTSSAVYVWRAPSFDMLPVFQTIPVTSAGEPSPANEVRLGFTPDSKYLQTFTPTSAGSTLEAWNVPENVEVFSAFPVSAGSLNPNETKVVTTSVQGGISIYPCPLCGGTSRLLAVAKQRITRSFTPAERTQYLTQG